eukprot:NODE_130_length_16779_cov_1.687410.p18 type:complete len:106 gc:universal NODE_130_length_16779_cov_1.687410:3405-3722(+)
MSTSVVVNFLSKIKLSLQSLLNLKLSISTALMALLLPKEQKAENLLRSSSSIFEFQTLTCLFFVTICFIFLQHLQNLEALTQRMKQYTAVPKSFVMVTKKFLYPG